MEGKDILKPGEGGLPSPVEMAKEVLETTFKQGEKVGQFISDVIDEIFK